MCSALENCGRQVANVTNPLQLGGAGEHGRARRRVDHLDVPPEECCADPAPRLFSAGNPFHLFRG